MNRVLLVHNFYRFPGGEDVVFQAEGDLLAANGWQVHRYTARNAAIDSMSAASLARRTFYNRDTLRDAGRVIDEFRPDIVHCHNIFPLISPAIYDAARSRGIPVVQTLHNFRWLCPGATFFRQDHVCQACLDWPLPLPAVVHRCYRDSFPATLVAAAAATFHRLRRTLATRVDAFITLWPSWKDLFVRGGLPADRIFVKPNFVWPDPGPGDGDGRFALFVGRLTPEKGLHVLLDAWATIGDIPLKIVGDGPLADYVNQAANSQIQPLGHQPLAEVIDLIGHATLLVCPSRWPEAPRSIIEAFARGTPVVAERQGPAADVITDGATGRLYTPGDAASLASAVRELWDRPSGLPDMRQSARAAYLANYTAPDNYSRLVEIYSAASR